MQKNAINFAVKSHLCSKKCHLNKVSRFCKAECSLPCGHDEICICKNKHYCNNKCILCSDYCCYEYGHNNHHLYNNEHDCKQQCNINGLCEIKTCNIIKSSFFNN